MSIPSALIPERNTSFVDIDTNESHLSDILQEQLMLENIASHRTRFYPNRSASRAEAYAMIMSSVCINDTTTSVNSASNWQQNTYTLAYEFGLTSRSWDRFRPNPPILRQEVFLIAENALQWAEETGGCQRKYPMCR